ITTPEQFFKSTEGHLSRFGQIAWKRPFLCRIQLAVVDEAHFIHTYGLSHYGLPAFRPAYRGLDEIKVIFGPTVVWAAMTATATSQALKSIEKVVLRPNYLKLQATSNRSNIMYASHCVPGRIDQPENYACFLSTPFDLAHQKRVLIFRDNMDAVVDIARYLDSLLPPGYRGRGVVRHYHSMMSDTYLARAHNDFTHPDGICKILVSTASESTGIDHPDVEIVCIAGLPSNVMDFTQRGGRAVRQISGDGLCVLFSEKWAREIDLGDSDLNLEDGLELDSIDFSLDIDRPRRLTLNIKSLPQDRASMACVLLTRRVLCMRAFFAKCMRDNTPGAVDFSTAFCCDSHGNKFNLRNFLPGTLYNPTLTADSRKEDAHLVSKKKQRSSITRKKLYQKLELWPSSLPHTIHSGQDVIVTLEQTHSWGLRWAHLIAKIISNFDQCNEKIRSPEFIEDSDCDESEWDAVFARERDIQDRAEDAAIDVIGTEDYMKAMKRLDKHRAAALREITNL
ncbi:hypothetical protein K435DRAFT_654065, partial [Dendrothele bispora CBS 962.96]